MKVLFATAEFSPVVRVGGLAEATAGLVAKLNDEGVDVDVVVPDYFATPLGGEKVIELGVPAWAGPATARTGNAQGVGRITLVSVPGIDRPNPYVDAEGQGWPDNADRFFAFSAAVAALTRTRQPDVLHCNDWHTAAALGFLEESVPSVLTIHTLGYQGWTSGGWLERIPYQRDAFEAHGGTNPMAGAIRLADRVIAVSPNYADEIRRPETGSGLDAELRAIGDRLVGIRNGIDTAQWNPAIDTHIASTYRIDDVGGKDACRTDLLDSVGWDDDGVPIVGMVTRLVDQKGVDLALDAVQYADTVPFRLVVLGSGERWLADRARDLESNDPSKVSFRDGYDVAFGHKVFAGSDLFCMPSRFEPCGLAQMQAMEYGTIPIVTDVGGLHDTVIDADRHRTSGNGFVASTVDVAGVVDAVHRACRAWRHPARRAGIQKRGMATDWSWTTPAKEHIEIYHSVVQSHL
ncbi:MAG: glycogen synthase [Acidimicrobiia bacterium]